MENGSLFMRQKTPDEDHTPSPHKQFYYASHSLSVTFLFRLYMYSISGDWTSLPKGSGQIANCICCTSAKEEEVDQ